MEQVEFNRTIRQIRSLTYCGEYDRALALLIDIVEKQGKSIEELKQSIKDGQ